MSKSNSNIKSGARISVSAAASLVGVFALLAVIGLYVAPGASAATVTWETLKTFGPSDPTSEPPAFPENAQLGGVSGMAINRTGAGGVKPGTVYTMGLAQGLPWHVARYSANGDFELAWTTAGRCGPKLEPATTCPTVAQGAGGGADIAVDQITGNVIVFYNGDDGTLNVIKVYKPDGTGPIEAFGGQIDTSGTVATSPERVHGSTQKENIAVDDAGDVYVFDEVTIAGNFFHRIMVFSPQTAGNLDYEYAGQGRDIGSGALGANHSPSRPMLDDAGHIYVSGENFIEEYDPAQPSSPTCTFSLPTGGITSATVNPETGAIFYYAYKPKPEIHQLLPCNAQGKFVESIATNPPFSAVPKRGFLDAMVLNPQAVLAEGDEPEPILYAGASEPCPPVGECSSEAEGQSSQGYIFASSESSEPTVLSESVTSVGQTTATLNAVVNPNGSQTTYVFQYITEAAYQANDPSDRFAGSAEAPAEGAVLGVGRQPLLAATTASGLSSGTTYRYRVVAANSAGSTPGSPEAFRTFAAEAPGLPDGRAWELVSPVQKNSGEVLPAAPNTASCGSECKPGLAAYRFPTQVSAGGDGIAYQGFPFTLNEGPSEYDEFVSTRNASGWQTRSLGPPLGDNVSFQAFALSSDLGSALVNAYNPVLSPEAPAGYRNLFSQPGSDRFDLAPLLKTTPPNRPPGESGFQLKYVGATSDNSHVFFEANDALTEETPFAPAAVDGGASKNNLYEWSEGELHLVNVQPGNAEAIPGAEFGSGLRLAKPSEKRADYSNAISPDGSRVLWSSESGQVYVREDGESTREIPDHTGKFLTASVDGSKVLLSDGVIYDLETEATTDLTEGNGGFKGIAGQSDDLSHVYFVDEPGLVNGWGDLNEGSSTVEGLFIAKGTATTTMGSATLTDFSTSLGGFAPGRRISGIGIPAGTTVLSVDGKEHTLTLSAAATASGEKVEIRSNGPLPFKAGQTIEGPGIPAGTTILTVGAETLELSAPATADKDDAALTAGILFASEEENSESDRPKLTRPNLYAWDEGSIGFVGTLLSGDNEGLSVWSASPVLRTAEASPDGRYLAFNSKAELTGIDSVGACAYESKTLEYVGSVPCEEVYLYDSASGELSCASCNPVGEHPHGGSFLRIMGGAEGHLEQPRYLTDSGRLYFDSRDSLVLHDTNNKVEDVYQYEPEGVGSCTKEGGCVSLISAGHESTDSNFLAMDESGKNVFFTTRDQLALKDHDDLIDLYVAREGGGIPSETETGRSECQGEACQPLYVAPNDPTPGSSTFQGAGNVDEKKAAKKHKRTHKKKKHAKKRHAKKSKRAKHNRGGAK